MTKFETLGLSPTTLNALNAMGFADATPVQGLSIPILLQGRDLIAQARTGTGKTAAFGIPLVEHAQNEKYDGVNFLILVPTRELALQVAEELGRVAQGTRLDIVPVYGGVGFGQQTEMLRRRSLQAIVATPGRLLDLMQQGVVRLDRVQFLVLDEADRMLDMGFLPDVERIVKALPRDRMTALFSATLPEPIKQLARRFLHQPEWVKFEEGPTATPLAEQFQITLHRQDKARALLGLLAKENPERTIVFTRTKHLARRLARQLESKGHRAVALQGNMTQGQRERALEQFREGRAQILVATDVASRGLDVPEVTHVVNFDVPTEPEAYVHRVGRTARMGRSGRAFTFVQPDQTRDLAAVERTAGLKLLPFDLGELPPAPEPVADHPDDRNGGRPGGRPPRGPRPERGDGDRNGGRNGSGGRGGGRFGGRGGQGFRGNRNGPRNGNRGGNGGRGGGNGPRPGGYFESRNGPQPNPRKQNRAVPPPKDPDVTWSESAPTYDPY